MSHIALTLIGTLSFLLTAFQILVFAQWILLLVDADPYNPIVRCVNVLVEPFLGWLRRRLPFLSFGAWDLSPLAAVLICSFLQYWGIDRLLMGGA